MKIRGPEIGIFVCALIAVGALWYIINPRVLDPKPEPNRKKNIGEANNHLSKERDENFEDLKKHLSNPKNLSNRQLSKPKENSASKTKDDKELEKAIQRIQKGYQNKDPKPAPRAKTQLGPRDKISDWKKAEFNERLALCIGFATVANRNPGVNVKVMEIHNCIEEATRGLEATNEIEIYVMGDLCIKEIMKL